MKSMIENGTLNIDFSYDGKFKFSSINNIFCEETYLSLQSGFQTLSWKDVKTDFYSQKESLISPDLENPLSQIYSKKLFLPIKNLLENAIGVEFKECIRVVAHELVTADEIDVHNDYCDRAFGYETHRLILQFGKENNPIVGGDIYFLSSENKDEVIKRFSYGKNLGVCFEISPHSYHYVSPVVGTRHTIIIYLWEKSATYDGSGMKIF